MARWTDIAVWRGPSPNTGDGDSRLDEPADEMYEYRGVVVHIAVGWYEGTIAWQHNTDADVSSHFVTGRKNGQLAQVVDTAIRAWTQSAGNGRWLSIENEGFLKGHELYREGWEKLSDWQIEANAQILARAHREYGVPLQLAGSPTGRGLGYHSMGAEHGYNWGHDRCPGEAIKAQLPQIVARAKEIVAGGGDMDQKDQLARKTALDGRTVGDQLADGQNLRDWWYDKPDAGWAHNPPPPGSRAQLVVDAAQRILAAGSPAVPPADQAAALKAALLDPQVLAAIAKAVIDEDHRRSAP